MFIDEELVDAAGPCPDVRQEFLDSLDPAACEARDAIFGSVVEVDYFAMVHIVRVRHDLFDELGILADQLGGRGDRVDLPSGPHQ